MRFFAGYELHPNPACYRRREFGRREVADHQPGRARPQNCISASSQRVDGEQGYQDARVEIDTQRSSSSRILLTKLPRPVIFSDAARGKPVEINGRYRLGLSRDGPELNHWPAMTRDDDILALARSINSGSSFLASATLWMHTEEL